MLKKTINTKTIVICGLFAALIAISGFIKIQMPSVPFTLQVLFVMLSGLLLGSKKGLLAVSIYTLTGLLGLPIFTAGGGIGYVFHPTFGYILGFHAAAYVVGALVEKRKNNAFHHYLLSTFVGLVLIYGFGMTYFHLISNIYLGKSFDFRFILVNCFLIFLPGDFLSCAVGSWIAKKCTPAISQYL